MTKRPATRRARRFLPKLSARDRTALERSLHGVIKTWGAEGWAFVGRPPRMRLAILVAKKLAAPANPVGAIALPTALRGIVKPSVMALHRDARVKATSGTQLPNGAGTAYLAPGAPVGCDNQRVGMAAVFEVDGAPHIVTCGHSVLSAASTLTTSDGATVIGTLRTNMLASTDALDAAVFAATDDGIGLLNAGTTAPTWCDSVHQPAGGDNTHDVTFWPTWQDALSPFVEEVESFSASVPGSVGSGFVMLTCCTAEGDSGSLLQRGTSYYALASQRDGNHSFFTPLYSVMKRLQQAGSAVDTWRPS